MSPGVIRINRKHLVSRDGDGRSALQLACEQGMVEVAELLGPAHQDKVEVGEYWSSPHYCQFPGRADPVSAGRRQEGGLGRGGGAG